MMFIGLALLGGCQQGVDRELEQAEFVVDAFYSFEESVLRESLARAESVELAVYYQAWARAANYAVEERRPCERAGADMLQCAIKVSDDFGRALGYQATDTFKLTLSQGVIVDITFEADDPPLFNTIVEDMLAAQPDIALGVCKDMFAGGDQPGACARAVVAAVEAYAKAQSAGLAVSQ